MRWARDTWNAFFYESATPFDLGVCRVLFFGMTLCLALSTEVALWAEVPDAFWMPRSFFRWFGLPVLSSGALTTLDWIWRGALALSFLGLFTRTSTATAFALGIYLLGLPHNFGKVDHGDAIVVLALAVFAVARCGDSWSLDALRSRARVSEGGEYTWPIRAIWVVTAFIYFGAGVSKLRHTGLDWLSTDNMANILLFHHYTGHDPPTDFGLTLAELAWVPGLMAWFAVASEVAAPLALFFRRLRGPIVLNLFLMQGGIWLLLGVSFSANLVCLLFWIPWERCRQQVRALSGGSR